jgi:hypothetical protein
MCICINIENESLRCLERSKVEKDATAVSFSGGMDFCLEKDQFDEVMGEEAVEACSDSMEWTTEEASSDSMEWTAEVCEMEWMEVHFDDEMEFEVEEDEDVEMMEVEMMDQESVMDFEFY